MKKLLTRFVKYLLLKNNFVWQRPMWAMKRERGFKVFPGGEYVRVSTLELLAYEIYELAVEGAVAELGVYQGDFAKFINMAFPGRKFYLFDTFEGFDPKDAYIDVSGEYSQGNQDFSATTIESVLRKMQYKENIITRKGRFPETTNGLEETFAFASIDTDLYQPTYEGLKYFYGCLNRNGYIMVHDYNNDQYKGVKRAVREFCHDNNVCYVPLTDRCGSVIIKKI